MEADFESRNAETLSELVLNREIFQKVCSNLGKPEIDHFVWRVLKQLKKYIFWKTDPFSMGKDAFQIS